MNEQRQKKSEEWRRQWSMFRDDERYLFEDWIRPAGYDDFRDATVLECGCGGGQHTSYLAPIARRVVAVDLNTTDIARERNTGFGNVEFIEADIAGMDLGEQFDVVICIGVIHHTDNPDATFENIYRHCRPGGKIIIWTYSSEGNGIVRCIIEPFRKIILRYLPRTWIRFISTLMTLALYPVVHTVYRMDFLYWLPYYEYFGNFRKMSFGRNVLNVFDKLNAPRTKFTTYSKCGEWFNDKRFEPETVSINKYKGVSYSLYGVKRRKG